MTLTLDRPDLVRSHNFIAGQWRSSAGGESYPVCDPATGEAFATVPDSGAVDAQAATTAAHGTPNICARAASPNYTD